MKRSRPAAATAEIAGIGKHSLVWTRAGRNAVASIEDDFSAKFKWPALLVAICPLRVISRRHSAGSRSPLCANSRHQRAEGHSALLEQSAKPGQASRAADLLASVIFC